MVGIGRRGLLGFAGILSPFAAAAAEACDETLHPETAGEEVAPGVREVFLSSVDVAFAGYGVLWVSDLVFRRGAAKPRVVLPNDMIVLVTQGLLRVDEAGRSYLIKRGRVGAFAKGTMVELVNTGADPAVLRVMDLLPGLGTRSDASAAPVQ